MNKPTILAAIGTFVLSMGAMAQGTTNYLANITTPGTTTNLFTSVGVPAAVGTDIWFVADKTGNGLGIAPGPVLDTVIAGWLGGLGENLVIYSDSVDGQILGTVPGRFTRNGVTINPTLGVRFTDNRLGQEEVQPTKVWAVLWNDSTAGDVGDQFAVFDLGTVAMPSVGNASWSLNPASLTADVYTVAAIPEPSTYAMMLLGGLGVLGYRRFKK